MGNGAGNGGAVNISGTGWLDVTGEDVMIGENGGRGTLTMSGDAKVTVSGGFSQIVYLGRFGASGVMTMTGNASYSSTRGDFVVGGGWAWNAGGPGYGSNGGTGGSAAMALNGSSKVTVNGQVWVGQNATGLNVLTINDAAIFGNMAGSVSAAGAATACSA